MIGPSAFFGFVPANLVAVALPWIELIAGVLLITGLWRREAAVVTAIMLAVFVVAVASTMIRGIDIQNCGCFALDASGRAAGWKLIAGDLALLAADAGRRHRPAPARRIRRRGEPGRRDLIA